MEFKLPNGRDVTLTGFFTGETNTWVDHARGLLTDKLLPVVRRGFLSEDFHVTGETWLKFICVAGFDSTPVRDPDSLGSRLHLVWFVDDNDSSIRELANIGLASCDWDALACETYRDSDDE